VVAARGSRVTIITGAGSGLGRATALRLARQGDSVCVCDVNEPGLKETAALIQSSGAAAFTGIVDVRDKERVEGWIGEVLG
jgi:NAD(P)-dependent dehydrogenase (short-subunit alcohol dehydrogenase family)